MEFMLNSIFVLDVITHTFAKPENVPIDHCYEDNIQDSVILMHSVEHNSLRHMSEIIKYIG